jgi:hypothetical protein
MAETQNYQNHVRWNPFVHFVVTPLATVNLFWQLGRLGFDFNWDRATDALVALVLVLLTLAARQQALTVQNRVVRLEEKLRYREVLPPALAAEAQGLRTGQMIALRFASDEELPELVRRTLQGDLKTTKEIKLAVKNWRGDYLRA